MTHPLDGARLKVVRAQEHLKSLNAAVLKYKSLKPYVVRIEKKPDEWHGTADITDHPDPMISAIIGDCLHNLSSALDYTMWEVVGTCAGRVLVPPPQGEDRIYFPLCENDVVFNKTISRLNHLKKENYKLTDAVIVALKSVQPYQAGYEPLSFFRELANADQHRLPLIIIGDIETISTRVITISRSPTFNLVLTDDPSYHEPQMNTQATVCVTWQDPFMPPEPVERTMDDFVKLVADIVPRFDRFCI